MSSRYSDIKQLLAQQPSSTTISPEQEERNRAVANLNTTKQNQQLTQNIQQLLATPAQPTVAFNSATNRDLYGSSFDFMGSTSSSGNVATGSNCQPQLSKLDPNQLKNKLVIIKEQTAEPNKKGEPEIVKSEVTVIQEDPEYTKTDASENPIENEIPVTITEGFLDENITTENKDSIKFSAKIKPN